MLCLGSRVLYGSQFWRVAAVGWVGERYYWLMRRGVVAMVPAVDLEKDDERK